MMDALVLLFSTTETGYKVWLFVVGLGAYLLGSIPFGYLIVKLVEGRDIRASGSGNIGAANVTRTVGRGAGVVTLLLDAGKGFLAVLLASLLGDVLIQVVAALCAILGHMFPVWLKFKGGKGVATGVGAFLPICGPAVAGTFGVWMLVMLAFQYVSLASMAAAAALPPLIYVLYAPPHAPPLSVSLGAVTAAILIIWKHRANIGRIIAGTEPKLKLGGKK
jgi:glycerol-3-phosphate acyltransferase PlsY